MRVLVTGAGGFIGAALTRQLVAKGYHVVAVENGLRGSPKRLQSVANQIQLIDGDIRDFDVACKATQDCQIVFHLAAINGTENFYTRPDLVLDVAIRGALATMDAALAHRATVRRYVCFSSSEVYNEPTHVPTTEHERAMIPDVTNPRFSYGGGKLASELLALHYLQRRGVPAIIIRPHNVYGPDMGDEHVIPQFVRKVIEAARKQSVPLQPHQPKHTWPTLDIEIQGNGNETRAFCFIDDFINGLWVATQQGNDAEIFHIGTQEETPIRDLLLAIGHQLGVHIVLKPGPRTAGSTPRRCPSIQKLQNLGYEPKVSLQEGLSKTVAWYRTQIEQSAS